MYRNAEPQIMDSIEPVQHLDMASENLAAAWKSFRHNFEMFLLATDSLSKPEEIQVAILLRAVGPAAIKRFNTFDLSDLEKKNLLRVLMEFEKYCVTPRRNQLYDTYLFGKRRQTTFETFDSFVDDVRRLVKFCGYENEDRMIRDRIVLGALDRQLQKRYFSMGELDLNEAIEMGRAAEKQRIETVTLNRLPISMEPSQFPLQASGMKLCSYCNLAHPWNVRCPAQGKLCNYCNRPNHYSGACRKKRHNEERLMEDLKERYGRMQM